jgi:hypothetical protein
MFRTTRSVGVLVFSLLAFAPQAGWAKGTGARILYESTMSQGGQQVKMQTTYLIQGGKVRFETEMPAEMTGGMPGKMTMIAKPAAKKFILLMEAQKAYMEIPEGADGAAAAADLPKVPFKSTGKTKTVAGYSCEVFERSLQGRKEEACTSKDLKDVFKELEKSMPKSKGEMSGLPEGLSGFPMEFSVKPEKKEGSQVPEIEMVVREFKREAIASAQFEIPKGFKKQEMPMFEMTADPSADPKKSPSKKKPSKKSPK